ncbi:G-protein alpha subunit-domain-containing protein [Lophiotrema nucula]|uniref:G-protein alpha subunit-domain-containing protein n=1 Tax=Lophiotrema nucula TaxID=690887 RepID=A0A6A5YRS8_9PLEO|nr:G-protein alpha subunit-domain-containing protein [Lophiotrema nucula]
MSSYNETLVEDMNTNQMEEALVIFKSICGSGYFMKTRLVLCFTKMDIFRRKLARGDHLFSDHFPDYNVMPGATPNDFEAAKTYITERFRAMCCENHAPLETYYINATSTDEVQGMWESAIGKVRQDAKEFSSGSSGTATEQVYLSDSAQRVLAIKEHLPAPGY